MKLAIKITIGVSIIIVVIYTMSIADTATYELIDPTESAEMYGGASVCYGYKCNDIIACANRCDSDGCPSGENMTSQLDCGKMDRNILSRGDSYTVCKRSNNMEDNCYPAKGTVAKCYYKTMKCKFDITNFIFKTGKCTRIQSPIENVIQGTYDCE